MTFKVLLHHYGRFTCPPGREFVGEMVATVDPVELDTFSTDQVKLILTNNLGYDQNSPTFLYIKKPNCSFDSGLVPLADAIQERDRILMYTQHNRLHIAYKLENYIDHIGVNFVISKYIFPNASLAEMMNHVITDYSSENEDIIRKITQNDYTFDQMVEWAEQEHFEDEETNWSKANLEEQFLALNASLALRFTDRRVEINNLMVLHDHPLIEYGKYALGCMTGADMKKCVYLKSVRDELLRSMEEKR
ncbi:hypothetical protein Tco_0896137 [Tanacetum coccineum]